MAMALDPAAASKAHLAIRRFGLGAKGDLIRDIAADPRGALLEEIGRSNVALILDPALPSTGSAIRAFFAEQQQEQRTAAETRDARRETNAAAARDRSMPGTAAGPSMAGGMDPAMQPPGAPAQPRPVVPEPVPVQQRFFRQDAMARIRHGGEAWIGYAERLVLFWSNHFCVSANKGPIVRASVGAMEREAIRPHVFGRFSDMLLAVEQHPAMLVYLDNRQSVGPGSRAGQNRRVGLNENLAREILELHTLGVDGGYTQADVTSLAKLITGWTFPGPQEQLGPAGDFAFAAFRHEPGPLSVLGRTYEGASRKRGERALFDLAQHPSTARHIARKLARHFVADEPPPRLVTRLAKVFEETGGNLRALAEALVRSDDSWDGGTEKMRSPYEFLMGSIRMLGLPREPGPMIQSLNLLGMPLWTPPGPNGFPDIAAHWASPENMKLRLDISAAIARRQQQPPQPADLAERLFDSALSDETKSAIRRAETRQQGLAILLMSPEMQRR
jgi:uncharacterized protein (DUF1800 family)